MSSLPDLLARHAAAAGHLPWLFYQMGWDWRWVSRGQALERVRAAAAALGAWAAAELPPGSARIAFPYRPRPEAVLLDLAIQTAGGVALPVPVPEEETGEELERLGRRLGEAHPAAWVEDPEGPRFEGPPPVPPELPRFTVPGGEGPHLQPERSDDAGPRDRGAGGVVVWGEEGARELSAGELAAAAVRLDGVIRPPGAGPPARTEVLVTARPLSDPRERLLVTWALAAGAALVLEPRLESLAFTAAWARPTVFAGDPAELETLAGIAAAWRPPPLGRLLRRLRGQPALPFGRLRVILCRAPVPPEGAAFWRQRGVRVLEGPYAAV